MKTNARPKVKARLMVIHLFNSAPLIYCENVEYLRIVYSKKIPVSLSLKEFYRLVLEFWISFQAVLSRRQNATHMLVTRWHKHLQTPSTKKSQVYSRKVVSVRQPRFHGFWPCCYIDNLPSWGYRQIAQRPVSGGMKDRSNDCVQRKQTLGSSLPSTSCQTQAPVSSIQARELPRHDWNISHRSDISSGSGIPSPHKLKTQTRSAGQAAANYTRPEVPLGRPLHPHPLPYNLLPRSCCDVRQILPKEGKVTRITSSGGHANKP